MTDDHGLRDRREALVIEHMESETIMTSR